MQKDKCQIEAAEKLQYIHDHLKEFRQFDTGLTISLLTEEMRTLAIEDKKNLDAKQLKLAGKLYEQVKNALEGK